MIHTSEEKNPASIEQIQLTIEPINWRNDGCDRLQSACAVDPTLKLPAEIVARLDHRKSKKKQEQVIVSTAVS